MRTPRQRRLAALIVTTALTMIATACVPYFSTPSNLTATAISAASGDTLAVVWSTAQDDDLGDTIASYTVNLDGAAIATLPAPANACALTGLTTGATYHVSVTASGTDGQTSAAIGGALTALGELSATLTATSAGTGGTLDCTPLPDTDGDRVPNLFETNTGTFANATDTGTDPAKPDTDDDGIDDGDEIWRTADGLDLPGMGVHPLRQDILLEFDWFDDDIDCGAHTHRPSQAAIDDVTGAFANAPAVNPDGTTGINLITDYGQGGPFTGGNMVLDADGVIASGVGGPDFAAIRSAHFASNREDIFHYVLMPHRYFTSSTSSGQAEILGDDMIVSNGCLIAFDLFVSRTIMHELGHNIGLRHGGFENRNWKPNYNSIMNYRYQFIGAETDCVPLGLGVTDFSSGTFAPLDETNIDETQGFCSGVAVDWNGNAVIETGITYDLNRSITTGLGDNLFTTHHDHDDWANLDLTAVDESVAPGAGARVTGPEIIAEAPVDPAYIEALFGAD